MNLKARIAAVVLAASWLGAGHAPAMDFLFFSRMNIDDQATYVTTLVEASARMLRTTGHPDQARKAIALFKDSTNHGGLHQFVMTMKAQNQVNIRNQDNPNSMAQVYDVESAMQETLHGNGIEVPLKFLESVNKGFAPQLPLKAHPGL